MWHSVKLEGYPPEKKLVIVTIKCYDGKRIVRDSCRYVEDLKAENYTDEFCKEHPSGIWEWLCEAGADYWEHLDSDVIAWTGYPVPYTGE